MTGLYEGMRDLALLGAKPTIYVDQRGLPVGVRWRMPSDPNPFPKFTLRASNRAAARPHNASDPPNDRKFYGGRP